MAGVSYTYVFGDDVAANLRKVVVPDPREQAYEDSPCLAMMEKRTIPLEGHYFHVDVSHVGTATGGPYVDNSVLSTAHVESVKVAQFTPSFYAEAARISRPQKLQTRGPRALFNAWAHRLDQARLRLRKKLSEDLFATSQVTNGITGLPLAIPATNTSGIYGLNRATYTWWRNYTATSVGAYITNGVTNMDKMVIDIRVAEGKIPDYFVTTEAIYAKVLSEARSTINFDPTYSGPYKSMLNDMGIDAVSYNGSPMFPDPYCDSGKIYGVTNNAFYMGVFEEWEIEGPESMVPFGVMAEVAFILWGGATICESQRALGQLSDVT